MSAHLRADRRLVAMQQQPRMRKVRERLGAGGDHHGRPVVTAHGVDRNHQRLGQVGAFRPSARIRVWTIDRRIAGRN
jgi:hypothetical protein